MRIRIVSSTLAAAALALALAAPASAYEYRHCWDGSRVDWGRTPITVRPSITSFPAGSAQRSALEAALAGWNAYAPGTQFRFSPLYTDLFNPSTGDGYNSIFFNSNYDWTGALAVTATSWLCAPFPSDLVEIDVMFDPFAPWSYVTSPATPPLPSAPYNFTIVALHELGHAFGLLHSEPQPATMMAHYPNGGTLGGPNFIHPLPDDVRGNRVAYGVSATARDVAASAYEAVGTTRVTLIAPPAQAYRGHPASFRFSVGNRGTTNEGSVRVQFYLSADRTVTTADPYLGAATYALDNGFLGTFTANVTVPASLPAGNWYFGWIVDPLGSLAEVDEANNAVALTAATQVPAASPPIACLTASPDSGSAPLDVEFDASCSSDPDGAIVSYHWDFDDGTTGTGVAPSRVFDTGAYLVRLTVTDGSGLTDVAHVLIDVRDNCARCPQ